MAGAFEYGSSTGGGKLRYKEFTASGTFMPTAKLLANGGQVFLDLRAGGGGGGGVSAGVLYGGGGSSKHITQYTVVGATTVTIGAGGAGNPTGTGSQGSSSVFGDLTIPGAGGGGSGFGGAGTGNEGTPGQLAFYGANSAFAASVSGYAAATSTTANSGAGGGTVPGTVGTSGQAGYCRVWWFE